MMKTRKMIILSLFSAISIVLTRLLAFYIPLFGSNDVRISLGDIPIMLAGLIFGPLSGALTGLVSDIIGATLLPAGPFFPGFSLSAMLVGAIPGLLKNFIFRSTRFPHLLMIILITELISSVLLNTLWLSMIFSIPYSVLLFPRTLITLIMVLVYASILQLLLKRLKKSGLTEFL